jgi:sulfite reductase (NADPH) flavoprotein alpha-component
MLRILFGTQSGNAANLAQVISDSLSNEGITNEVWDMGELDPNEIQNFSHLLIVTSTYGDGEAPDNASEWFSYLKFAEDLDLTPLRYAVLGLGDTYYPHFCQCAKDFDQFLARLGARPMLRRLDCDLYFEEQYPEWLNELIPVLKKELSE